MNRFKLITAGIRRHKLRTLFMVMSVMVAFAIFIVLNALDYGLGGLVNYGMAKRVNIVGMNGIMPVRYAQEISAMPGIETVSYYDAFYAYYRDMQHGVFVQAGSFPDFMKVYPEFSVTPASAYAAMRADRRCAFAGSHLAKKYNWKVGQVLPLINGAPNRQDGTNWTYRICGIYTAASSEVFASNLITRYDYYNENKGAAFMKDRIQAMIIMIRDVRDLDRITYDIDARYAHSVPMTMTLPDNMLIESMLKSFGDIGGILLSIAVVVFFAMLLVSGSTTAESIRGRMNEFAMLRALGFTRQQLVRCVLGEAALVIGIGAVLGIILGKLICDTVAPSIRETLPFFMVRFQSVALSIVLAAIFAVAISWLPARRVMALEIADTLRRA